MKHLLTGASALALTLAMAGTAQAEFSLTILHINDFHSRIDPITDTDSTCSPEDDAAGECFGGIARMVTAINERRAALEAEGRNVIVLDAGDQYQGSLFYTTYRGEEVVEFMNLIGFDAMAVGNHEFDDGPEGLLTLIEGAEFPVISGNTVVDGDPLLSGLLPGAVVLEVGGELIGIVSVLAEDTSETASPGPDVYFLPAEDYLKGAVDGLQAAGVDKIIALTHIGVTRDIDIASSVSGIDVIVGGHSHTLFSNTEDAPYSYPFLVENPLGVEVPIVQAYAYSKYLGEIEITWDDEGTVISAVGDPILLDASIVPDEAVAARVDEMRAPIEELIAEVIGVATAPIDGSRETCRFGECEMGNLVADAILDYSGVQIVIQNGGGLRASIGEGDITMGDILTVLPFGNALATFELTGAGVLEALENGVSDWENGAGRFPQVAGLQYVWDRDAPAGGRIVSVEVLDDGEWVPIEEETVYTVATNDFMRNGGDGYAVFAEDGQNAYDFGPALEVVVTDYIASLGGEYTPYLDGRISEVE